MVFPSICRVFTLKSFLVFLDVCSSRSIMNEGFDRVF